MKYLFIIFALFFSLLPDTGHAITSFPGAEGSGAYSVGGRGGAVLKVTNLNDDGAGSLRAAVETAGARYIVFDVSGIINLESPLIISESYVTIAGQTSPGGICIAGFMLKINAQNVVIQHMRFRTGSHRIGAYDAETNPYGMNANAESLDCLQIWGNYIDGGMPNIADNIIIDHCSFSWSVDELMETAYGPINITIQWCIFSEGLSNAGHPDGEHSKGPLFWGPWSDDMRVSFHHNYMAHNKDRSPLIDGGNPDGCILDAVNNVAYDYYGGNSMISHGTTRVNWINNYCKAGPLSNVGTREAHQWNEALETAEPAIYVYGNLGSSRSSVSGDEWDTVGSTWTNDPISTDWRQLTPWTMPYTVSQAAMSSTYADTVLSTVGATKPERDSEDARLIAAYIAGTGGLRQDVTYPDDWPTYATPDPPADTDSDGMADAWETSTFGDLDQTAVTDFDSDGYDDLEEYLHYLGGYSAIAFHRGGGQFSGNGSIH